jgi:DNA modification methylase
MAVRLQEKLPDGRKPRRMSQTRARITIVGGVENPGTVLPAEALRLAREDEQKGIPAIAKDPDLTRSIEEVVQSLGTAHDLFLHDCRDMSTIPDASVHLIVTSPPYWTLKKYPEREGQLGEVEEYNDFVRELGRVWAEVYRVLVPGGRLVVVVGDVCVPRRRFGRHVVFPLHASIQETCREIGFDNLAPIIWHKIANAQYEAGHASGFLGKPYEPNSIIKNDIEYILFQRKPGGYRRPSLETRILSVISTAQYQQWFRQIWSMGGASTRAHPAPFPLALAERLIRMFSFVGDTVLDPFMGTGTTNLAASKWGRNSIGFDIEPAYFQMAKQRLMAQSSGLFSREEVGG